MDPRRARDPRLARADPRLQNRPSTSNSPAPAPLASTPDHVQQPQQPQDQLSAPTPPSLPSDEGPSGQAVSTNGQNDVGRSISPQEQATPSSAPQSAPESRPKYKPKPLFCVVCASNQVSRKNRKAPPFHAKLTLACRIAQWRHIMFYSEQNQLDKSPGSDLNLVKRVFGLYLREQAPLCDCLDRQLTSQIFFLLEHRTTLSTTS